jgi:phosphoribosylanthranilate isomerase
MSLVVKICGLSTPETVDAALSAGADWLGFVFFPKSPRHVRLEQAARLGRMVGGTAQRVALSVDASDDQLATIVEALQPDCLQLHGSESPDRVAAIRSRFGIPVMKAIGIGGSGDLARATDYLPVVDWLLFDAKPPRDAHLPGGNGRSFDWTLLAGLDLPKPHMLSGGLDSDNVATALAVTRAPGVDVSSGVERSPGAKDPALIHAFVAAARGAASPASPPARAIAKDMPA